MDDKEVKNLQRRAYKQLMAQIAAAEAKEKARTQADPHKQERRAVISSLVVARYKQKMTQAELARRTGLTRPAIARLEKNNANPSLKTLLSVVKALGLNLVVE